MPNGDYCLADTGRSRKWHEILSLSLLDQLGNVYSQVLLWLSKSLIILGLQGHQADLVVPTNKNNTGQIKMLLSFKLSSSAT